mgnify:CR=1 FL=1
MNQCKQTKSQDLRARSMAKLPQRRGGEGAQPLAAEEGTTIHGGGEGAQSVAAEGTTICERLHACTEPGITFLILLLWWWPRDFLRRRPQMHIGLTMTGTTRRTPQLFAVEHQATSCTRKKR